MEIKPSNLMIKDIGESGFKLLTALTEWLTISKLAIKTGLHNSTVRRLMNRLEAFGLVKEETRTSKAMLSSRFFNITKEGQTFLKRVAPPEKPKKKEVIIKQKEMIESKDIIHDNDVIHDSIVVWLRKKAQELNDMADNLSNYDE